MCFSFLLSYVIGTPEGLEYVFVKDVVESATGNKLRLLNPILIRLRQEQVVLAYPFKYLSAVNGKAAEVIVNYENRKNFTGCDDTSPINPTCGIKHEKGVSISYSEGFCCFCPETPVKEKQVRGGQDCSLDVGDPNDFEKQKYKASAHCLHLNDIWYTVSALDEPIILHETFLQVYNQRHLLNGSSVWVALTHEEDFELGVKNPYQYDDNKTIAASFFTSNPKNSSILISNTQQRLLVPQPMPAVDLENLPPAVKNGASDYIFVPKAGINPDGDECDTAGVSYEGFAKQGDRCNVVKDTCLKNQPLDFWEIDNEKRKGGKKGTYLLENFGTPYKDPIIVDPESKEHWLAFEYYEKHLTVLTIELNADNIIALTVGKHAQISTIVTSNVEKKIDFYVGILNSGLVPAKFSVQAVRCGFDVSDSNNVSAVVPPQLKHDFVVTTKVGSIEIDEKFECIVEVSSALYGTVALREVAVKPSTRCICNIHCICVCLGESLECVPMSEEDYHLAGFRGSLPILTAKPPYKSWIEKHPFLAVLALLLFFLLFGFIKGSFGLLGNMTVGGLGLRTCIYQPKKISKYIEPEFKGLDVVYDEDGYPVNPDTKQRARVCGDKLLFLYNLLFFFIWPCIKIRDSLAENRRVRQYNDISMDDDSPDVQYSRNFKDNADMNKLSVAQNRGVHQYSSNRSRDDHPFDVQYTGSYEDIAAMLSVDFDDSQDETGNSDLESFVGAQASAGNRINSTMSESAIHETSPFTIATPEARQWHKGMNKVQAII